MTDIQPSPRAAVKLASLQIKPPAIEVSTQRTDTASVAMQLAGVQQLDTNPYSNIDTHMKTTIELPDNLLKKAKATALKRNTTLKELITKALQREITPYPKGEDTAFKLDESGLPYLPSRNVTVTNQIVAELLEEEGS